HAPADPRKFAPEPRSKRTNIDPPLPLRTHVPAVSPGMVTTTFFQTLATSVNENGEDRGAAYLQIAPPKVPPRLAFTQKLNVTGCALALPQLKSLTMSASMA